MPRVTGHLITPRPQHVRMRPRSGRVVRHDMAVSVGFAGIRNDTRIENRSREKQHAGSQDKDVFLRS